MAYSLAISKNGLFPDIFHVACLKKNLGPTTHIQTKLPMLDEERKLVMEPKCIREVRTKILQSRIIEYLIKTWRNFPEDEASWEHADFR